MPHPRGRPNPTARVSSRKARATAAKPASTSGAGSAVVAPIPPASATTDTANAERSTTDRSVVAAHPKIAVAITPSVRSKVGPVELGVQADGGDVDRHEEGAEVEERTGGGGKGRLEAATGDQEAAGGEEEDTELQGVGDGAPVDGHEHGRRGQEQEGTRAGHPDRAGAGGVGRGRRGVGTGRSAGSSHAATVRRSGPPGDPADPLGLPGGSPIRCRAPGRSARAPASG